MASIWSEALGVPVSDPEVDFFTLGGSSLLAMQIAADATLRLKVKVSVVDVLISGSLRELVKNISDVDV